MTPQMVAGTTSFAVRIRKKAAVKTAAITGDHAGIGMRSTNCGFASKALVTSVSRPPVADPGRYQAPSSTCFARPGWSQRG